MPNRPPATPDPAKARPRVIPEAGPHAVRPETVRILRAGFRLASILAWTVFACAVQAVLIRLPGRAKIGFAQFYWKGMCRLIGLRVVLSGIPAARHGQRVVFIANHCSWLDIAALGARLPACFVSKDDVARWPGISIVARLGRTLFVSRTRAGTGRERDDMRARLAAGDSLILFPEGTSSDGARVLPFRSAFFSLAEDEDPPVLQPVSLVYDRLDGLPVLRGNRPALSWYGGMDLLPHLWRVARHHTLRATILLHPPVDPRDFESRKMLAEAIGRMVAEGAAGLRRGRGHPHFS